VAQDPNPPISRGSTSWINEPEGIPRPPETVVRIGADTDIILARQQGRALASEIGFGREDLALIATAISELARNIVNYARTGEIALRPDLQNGRKSLVIISRDRGPGIADVEQAMRDGYSTSGGLGLGLPGTRRLMDEFTIQSTPGAGTTVTVRKWKR
jgi:serine/threonine-protein kinase RsbT